MEKDKIVYIVHAVDTEGPLHESLSDTFDRLKDTFDIILEPTYDTLDKLRKNQIPLNGKENIVAKFLSPALLKYNDSWDKIDNMLSTLLSSDFRNKLLDSYGGGWIFNWHCIDHVDYDVNPRSKSLGYHAIHDRYVDFLDKYHSSEIDPIYWHFHPMSTYREAHRCATSYVNSTHLHQSLCRRIIERKFFPSSFRAGFHTERPDSHWFLEQWIPFDCSNLSFENLEEFETQNDFKNGRFFDWRRAPSDWSVYHPDYYDYQIPGQCNRSIGRFLQINTRMANITQEESDKAFKNANEGMGIILGVTNHDYRNMMSEVDLARKYIQNSSQKYPQVKFKFCNVNDAFNAVVNNGDYEKLDLNIDLQLFDKSILLNVSTKQSTVFGPQPYLAVKTKSKRFIHDNFAFGLDGKSWSYIFDEHSIRYDDVDVIGIAANNKYGNTFVKTFKLNSTIEIDYGS
ncbi:MAG: hypothetical protein K9L30_04070 [Desulfobacterales bacterium]|nr:hypothetical protein [Desulfobacterales bacterium]